MSGEPNEFSIGYWMRENERIEWEQREAERDDRPPRDPLADYAASLSATSHPPNECGDPFDCPACGPQYRAHHGA